MGGTIFFKVQDYQPYNTGSYFLETDRYFIYSVEPTHSGIAKRYSVKVILKESFSFQEIALINQEIIQKIESQNIYENEMQEKRRSGKKANLIFCYFGLDETDITNRNFLCHTTWTDESQDKRHWYRVGKNCEVINGIHFNISSYYQSLKIFTEEHIGSREQLISETRKIMSGLITLVEKMIFLYNEYLNGTSSEADFITGISTICSEIDKLYFAETELDIPPNDLRDWCQCCSNLAATIHNMTLYYGNNNFSKRTPENRKACMDMSIKQYYKEIEAFKILDSFI